MRLRASSATVDLMAAVGADDRAEVGVPHGAAILAFVRAILGAEPEAIADTRNLLAKLAGESVAADVAGVCAHFNGINRVAEGTGVKVNDFITPVAELRDFLLERHGADLVAARSEQG